MGPARAAMIFRRRGREYAGRSASDVVRALEHDAAGYRPRGGPLRDFLAWSLERLGDRVPARELDLSERLDDETVAMAYLCLCEEYGVGRLVTELDVAVDE